MLRELQPGPAHSHTAHLKDELWRSKVDTGIASRVGRDKTMRWDPPVSKGGLSVLCRHRAATKPPWFSRRAPSGNDRLAVFTRGRDIDTTKALRVAQARAGKGEGMGHFVSDL